MKFNKVSYFSDLATSVYFFLPNLKWLFGGRKPDSKDEIVALAIPFFDYLFFFGMEQKYGDELDEFYGAQSHENLLNHDSILVSCITFSLFRNLPDNWKLHQAFYTNFLGRLKNV